MGVETSDKGGYIVGRQAHVNNKNKGVNEWG